jgi:hypothetical protein
LIVVTLILIIQRRQQIRKRFEEQKENIMDILRAASKEGRDVRISVMHGLIHIEYKDSNNSIGLLDRPASARLKALPVSSVNDEPTDVVIMDSPSPSEAPPQSVAAELEKLVSLLEQGFVSKAEFDQLKRRLLGIKKS